MRTRLFLAVALAAFAGTAMAQAANQPLTVEGSTKPGIVGGGQSEQVTATVTAIDLDKRLVTLKNAKGESDTFEVGKDVKNLPQVKVGDRVVVDFWRGVALQFQPPGTPPTPPSAGVAGEAAAPGAKPGGEAVAQLQGTVTIKAIDAKTRVVTLETEKGRVFRLKAGPTIDLTKAKVGMQFLGTYTAGVAVNIQPAPAKKKSAKPAK
jgi:Cu/Ag efflux protein CusF